jgi:hypothetical protein
MAGSWRGALAALGTLIVLTPPTSAFGGRWTYRPTIVVSYVPIPVYPCTPAAPRPIEVRPIPKTPSKPMPLAQPLPKPAPATSTSEPPLATPLNAKRPPVITESRSSSELELARGTMDETSRCRVGFWNITGVDVTLTIDGQARQLPKDRAVTILLQRSFVWQISGRAPQTERIPSDRNTHEVILRP